MALCLLVALVSLVGLVGAGAGSDTAFAAAKAGTIKIDARNFAFSPKKITVKAGKKITIALHSKDATHDFTIQGGDTVVEAGGGKTKTGTFTLAKKGKYTFYCSIPGHRAAGMQGTITAN
jgi:plastocyanin